MAAAAAEAEGDRSPKMKNQQLSLLFPDEIIEEIFSRVAVEPLMKFRCVSKSLNALICSKRFIKLHLENSRKNRSFPYQRVIITLAKSSGMFEARQCSLQSLLNLPWGYRDLVDFPMSSVVRVVGSCNGVVCIMRKEMRKEREFIMWNPATRAVRKLPPLKLPPSDLDLGWDLLSADMCWEESRNAYKVFAFLLDRRTNSRYAGSLYSSDTDSWSTTLNQGRVKGQVLFTLGNGQFVSGKFHWLVEGIFHWFVEGVENWKLTFEIVSFDPESGAFGVIGLPSDATLSDYYRLAVVGGCLYVLGCEREPGIGIWKMKEYGVVNSWQKVGATELLQPSWFVRGEDGEVVLLPSFLVCCNGKIQGTWVDGRIWRAFQMHLHIQTLVSP